MTLIKVCSAPVHQLSFLPAISAEEGDTQDVSPACSSKQSSSSFATTILSLSLLSITKIMACAVLQKTNMTTQSAINSAKSDPRSYETTKAVAKKAQKKIEASTGLTSA